MLTTTLALLLAAAPAAAPFELVPGTRHDARIPAPEAVLGHDFGEVITPPEGIALYLKALAAAAPERTRLVEYGRSWEGRPLHVLAIGAPERIAALDAVKAKLRRFADPRTHAAGEAEALVKELPAVTWLLHAVHGNEISSSDAALVVARHLLAAQGDADVDAVLRESIVLIDPLENPDGRARYLAQNALGQAATPDPEPASAEHDEPWPGGRSNHYLFDMNRDWFALTQPETRSRVKLALEWFPHVTVDLHEMGGDATYYFAPPADPENPYITEAQRRWFDRFGRANGDRFDARGFAYFVREVYDSFYPGYGESWPIFQGAIGMTYEQASPRGLVYRRRDDSVLTYAQAVLQHATAALQTAVTAAKNREPLLRDYLEYRRSAATAPGPKEYVLVPGADPSRATRLAELLAFQGIDVRRAEEPVKLATRTLPAGSYLVSAAQPSGRMVRNLLEHHVPLPEEFVKRQLERRAKRMRDEIYDVTAWSLPLLFDVEAVTADRPLSVKTSAVAGVLDDFGSAASATAAKALPAARVGYLVPWGAAAAETVAEALRAGLKGRVAGEGFKLAGRDHAIGTVLFRTSDNGPGLAATLGAFAGRHGAEVVAVDSGYVDDGISLGSGDVHALRAPRVLLVWDTPTSSLSAGWTRWVLERRFGQPASAVRTATLRRVDLRRYDVIVMPSGDYSDALGGEAVRRLKDWVRTGGTLVTLGEASRWAAKEKVGLLATRTELKDGSPEVEEEEGTAADKGKKPAAKDEAGKPFDYDKAITPEKERPDLTPGALLRVKVETEHWLSAGSDGELAAIVESQRVFTPIKLDKGRNVATYAEADKLVTSGLAWDEAKSRLARKSYLIHQPSGDGHVIAFAEDPNYRGYAEATSLLFMNAVLFGPAF
ncbi:MAG: M14 family metallopeptidase [Vicinamibacteria bacterium]|nr:M14 family metallopeptidase [Vicinamibacteria bacterium]